MTEFYMSMKCKTEPEKTATGVSWSLLIKYYPAAEIKINEKGRACATYEAQKWCTQTFGGETWNEETIWNNVTQIEG